jgi:hypothetical protein
MSNTRFWQGEFAARHHQGFDRHRTFRIHCGSAYEKSPEQARALKRARTSVRDAGASIRRLS